MSKKVKKNLNEGYKTLWSFFDADPYIQVCVRCADEYEAYDRYAVCDWCWARMNNAELQAVRV